MPKLVIIGLRLLLLLLVVPMASCITTESGGVTGSESKEDAVEARVNLALQYLRKRDFEAARRNLKLALDIAPRNADVHDAMAHTFSASGDLELADKHYRMAVGYGGDTSRYRFNYANFLLRTGEFERAEKLLVEIADDSLYEKRGAALVLLGMTQQQLLKTDEAKRSFQRALVLDPNNIRVLRELAILSYDDGEIPKSWEYFSQYRQLVRQQQSQPTAEMLLLGIHLAEQLGEKDAAASYVLALRNLYPNSKEYASYQRHTLRKTR